MNQNLYYRVFYILFIGIACQYKLYAKMQEPIGTEEDIVLNIDNKERIYYELDKNGLIFQNIGKDFYSNPADSLNVFQIGIFSRTIKAPTGKELKNFGFNIIIDGMQIKQLKYNKSGSSVTSPERPGWNYTKSGIWYFYLNKKPEGYNIEIKPIKGSSKVYLRLISKQIRKRKLNDGFIKTVNRQDRWRIATLKEDKLNNKTTHWYLLKSDQNLQYKISGPTSIKLFSRLLFNDDSLEDEYLINIYEDGNNLGDYFIRSKKSNVSKLVKTQQPVGEWESIWFNVPKGNHYYTISLPNIENNYEKSIFIRLREWNREK